MSIAIARRYAQALLADAADEAEARAAADALAVAAEVLGDEQARRALGTPSIPREDQAALLDDLVKAMKLPAKVAAFLKVLFQAGLLGCLPDAVGAYRALFEERFAIRRAEVRAAAPLEDEDLDRLREKLEELTGGRVEVDLVEDPELVAGWRARVGNFLIEADLGARLARVRERLVKG